MTIETTKIPRRHKCVNKEHPYIGGAIDILDDDLQLTQAQINAIALGGAVTQNLSASPSPIFVGQEYTINLNATINTSADTINIKKNLTVIATGSGMSLSGSDIITPSEEGNIQYVAEFILGGLAKTANKDVIAVYPIRIGTGTIYVDGTPLTDPKISPAGTYNIIVANDGDYIYFNVPSTMTINKATMSGFDFPLESPQAVEINGVNYNSYRSSNTYDAGTLTIIIS